MDKVSLMATGAINFFTRKPTAPVIANVTTSIPSTGSLNDVDKVMSEVKRMRVESDEKDRRLAQLEAALQCKN